MVMAKETVIQTRKHEVISWQNVLIVLLVSDLLKEVSIPIVQI